MLKFITKISLSCVQLIDTCAGSTATKSTRIPKVLEYMSMGVGRISLISYVYIRMAKDVVGCFCYLGQERK